MALTTQLKSSCAACARADADARVDERFEDAASVATSDEGVEDASSRAQGGIVTAPGVSGVRVPRWLMQLTSSGSSLGRERASATTFALPCK